MKVLFIAYYFEPFSGVGAKRVSYWAKNLKRINNIITKCDVITAIPQVSKFDYIDNVFYIENTNEGLLRKFIKFDRGASWLYNLKNFVKNNINKNDYDFVILTGDPFLHFFIVNDFKDLGIKTIIDFRDPFANNPRGIVKDTLIKKIKHFALKKIENYFLSKADYVITVNKYCIELFENYKKHLYKMKIIDNGYDEQIFTNINMQNNNINMQNKIIKFAYAGKLYADRNPQIFFNTLKNFEDVEFYHIGERSEYISENSKQIHSLGFMSYYETISTLNTMNVCTIFTSGHFFESTTKVFDYIALNKVILIITDGEIQTGQLYDILKDYPYTYWVNNNQTDIENVLNIIKNNLELSKNDFDSYTYSREYGLIKLISILKENYE